MQTRIEHNLVAIAEEHLTAFTNFHINKYKVYFPRTGNQKLLVISSTGSK
jgi:hypothetical protein